MRAHRPRNIKTAGIFACCLAFLIFCGTCFEVIADLVVFQAEGLFATDLYVQVIDINREMPAALHEAQITEFLEQQRELDGAVIDFSFVSYEMAVVHQTISPYVRRWNTARVWDLSTFADIPWGNLHIFGVQRNLMNATYQNHYYPVEYHQAYFDALSEQGEEPRWLEAADGWEADPIEMLYSDAGIDEPNAPLNRTLPLSFANATLDAAEYNATR
jgi:hypothetical protein